MKKNKLKFKPYLINAFFTWSIDSNQTPIIEVSNLCTNSGIPTDFFQNGLINLNIHPTATRNMILGKENIEFDAIFSGEQKHIVINYEFITKIFNKEDGYGLDINFDFISEERTNHGNDTQWNDPNSQIKPLRRKGNLVLIKND